MLRSFSPLFKKKKDLPKPRSEKTPRREFGKHERWIRSTWTCFLYGHPDHVCEGSIETMHVRGGTHGPLSDKPESWWTIPGCQGIHRWQHQHGERAVERKYGVVLRRLCLKYARSSPDRAMKEAMAEAQRCKPHLFEV